ncbi:ABC transporter permease [Sphingomonas sp.]|uniref:ABC transporter permease n=1 Tax=Sphingomonas sp. TaxID=28214 RepID=UPI0025D42AF1|nr:ABC transporter permease [Sphingomonas sp.]
MNRTLSSIWVIARRDFTATVFSRTFLLFLLGPLMALGFGGLFGVVGGRADDAALRSSVAVIGSASDTAPIRKAYAGMNTRLGGALPDLRFVEPKGDVAIQARGLLSAQKNGATIVLTGWPAAPRLVGPARQIDDLQNNVRLILDEIRTADALKQARIVRPEVKLQRTVIDPAGGGTSAARHIVARGAQSLLFMLTLLLAGMLLSNMVEEKSSKVIEVLAAAVPIDAIFYGKLIAMLGVSLTGIIVWGSVIGIAVVSFIPAGMPLPLPAMGWPLFITLGAVYYIMNYMLLGGAFIGIGAQANSAREVQTLSMPITMSQLAVFALASATVNDTGGPLATFAAIFPLSSPLAMLGRAAQDATLWPHLLALIWQAAWVAIIVRFAARRFRTGVLKSGAPRRKWFGRTRAAKAG